jgi:hypothetical protein
MIAVRVFGRRHISQDADDQRDDAEPEQLAMRTQEFDRPMNISTAGRAWR